MKTRNSAFYRRKLIFFVLALLLSFPALTFSFDQRTNALIEGAKKEKKLVLVTMYFGTDEAKLIIPHFKKYYGLEDLDVQFSRMNTEPLVRKTEEELKVGKLSYDLLISSVVDWAFDLARRGAIMKYASPEDKAYGPAEKLGLNNPGFWTAEPHVYSILYNPKFVKKEITSWNDLLDPSYKGKIAMGNVEHSFSYALNYLALQKALPKEYFPKLADQKIMTAIGGEGLANYVATGQHPIAVFVPPRLSLRYALKNVTLKMAYPKEGVPALPLAQFIMASCKNPNASKLWIDWVRSRPGQEVFTKACALISGREGMPARPADIKPEVAHSYPPRVEDLKIIPVSWKDVTPADSDKAQKDWIDIFTRG